MNATEPTRRHWLTHERAVLLIVALVVALGLCWLGWQVQVVRYRLAVRKQIEASGAVVFVGGFDWKHSRQVVQIRPGATDRGISTARQLLGDERADFIGFNRQLTDADKEAIEAFPEADVHAVPPPSSAP